MNEENRIILNESHRWQGACLDTGAQATVFRLFQARAYCLYIDVKFKPENNNHKYKYVNDRQTTLGSINIRTPIPKTKSKQYRLILSKPMYHFQLD